jgi:hypothetical protein
VADGVAVTHPLLEAASFAGPPGADAYTGVLRDIYGNPFKPVAFDPSWRTSSVLSLACMMYDTNDFTAALVLADALQDGGCESEDILSHLRGPGPHVRGCWVTDLVLGRE